MNRGHEFKHKIRIKDRVSTTRDVSRAGGIRGEVIFGVNKKVIPFIDPFGNQSYRTEFEKVLYKDTNIVLIGGYQFAFNKLFNIAPDQESTLRVGDLNDEAPLMKIGVQRSEYVSTHYNAETSVTNPAAILNSGVNIPAMNFIFGFMIGDGGAREDNMTAVAPDYKRRTLFRAIPFRMSNDGTKIPNGQYFGRSTTFAGSGSAEAITSYFIKKFDSPPPRIVHVWVTDNPQELSLVDDSVFASTSSIPIESYVEMNMSVSHEDGRGFFTSTQSTPRINEFGLVSGWYNGQKMDYESIRLFTHFSRSSINLSEGDSIEAIYRLYAR